MLHDDPAAAWLSPPAQMAVAVAGGVAWAAFGVFLVMLWLGGVILSGGMFGFRLPSAMVVVVGGALVNPVRRAIIRLRNRRAAARVRAAVPSIALPVDDWTDLGRHADGRVISVVGWVRGRNHLAYPVTGRPCVGLALACQDKYPGVLESLHDFDLVDESGQSIPIRVAGGRMLGEPNVQLSAANTSERLLVASLEMPVGAVPADWRAFVVRDGDPILVVGLKTSIVDPDHPGLSRPVPRAAVGSAPSHPLLIFPIEAERRDV